MGTKRLIAGSFVCAVAAVAACLGGTPSKESTGSQYVLMSSQSFYDYGMVMVGSSATSTAFIISSQGSADDDTIIDITENCGDFDLDLNPSPQGYRVFCDSMGSGVSLFGAGSGTMCIPNSYAFTASFTPVGAGPSSCTVRVDYMATSGGSGSAFNITLQGSGVAPQAALSISPPSGSVLAFGDIPVNQQSSPQTVSITNTGQTTLNIAGVLSGPYVIVNGGTLSPSLDPGFTADYDVACEPTVTGPAPGSLMFTSAAPAVGVTFSCNGTAATDLGVSPNPGTFASALVGKSPPDLDVAITNNGSVIANLVVGLQANTPELMFAPGGDPNGTQLGPGQTAHAILTFSAASERTMAQLGTLDVNYSPGGSNIAIAINGEALPGTLGVSPGTAIDFGPVCVGATVMQPVTLYASAAGEFDVTGVTTPQAPFSATSTSGTLLGNRGNMLMLMVEASPTAPGDLTDKLVVHTTLAVPEQVVSLTAKALPAGVSPTPGAVHFGPNRVDMTTTAKEVIVTNCDGGDLTVQSSRIEGVDAADFTVVSQLPQPLPTRGSTRVLIVMTPHANGSKQATLVLGLSNGAELTVSLDGNGFAGDDASDGAKGTYYACDAGGASGFGAALGLVALGLVRRRRRA
ncbi:MAG: choice-of-anchor D domain-containing protein [Myxococcales bacterium]|nr:choice-of-anchor D domain-containing protein [Myxococcales bacterium]